jgi:hypothetical protein
LLFHKAQISECHNAECRESTISRAVKMQKINCRLTFFPFEQQNIRRIEVKKVEKSIFKQNFIILERKYEFWNYLKCTYTHRKYIFFAEKRLKTIIKFKNVIFHFVHRRRRLPDTPVSNLTLHDQVPMS